MIVAAVQTLRRSEWFTCTNIWRRPPPRFPLQWFRSDSASCHRGSSVCSAAAPTLTPAAPLTPPLLVFLVVSHKEAAGASAEPRGWKHLEGGDSISLIDSSFDLFLYFITSTHALFPCSFHLFPTWLNTDKLMNLCRSVLCSEHRFNIRADFSQSRMNFFHTHKRLTVSVSGMMDGCVFTICDHGLHPSSEHCSFCWTPGLLQFLNSCSSLTVLVAARHESWFHSHI